MKKNLITWMVGLLYIGFTAASCLSSDEADYSQYRDCDITAFSVGDINTTRHTLTAAGKDSTYTETLSGDSIKWEIDQLAGKIYNLDSLPVGTNVEKIVATISANGTVARDSAGTLLYFGNGSDSLNFTNPQIFRIIPYANANKGDYTTDYRQYTVEVRVHQVDPDAWTWDNLPAATSFPGSAFTAGQKAVEMDGTIYVFGTDGTTPKVSTSTNGETWTEAEPLTGYAGIDYASVLADTESGKFYAKAADGSLCSSTDGAAWAQVSTNGGTISTLLYKENKTFYAVAGGKLMSMGEDGRLTTLDVDGDEGYLPAANIHSFTFPGSVIGENSRSVLLGTGAQAADTAVVAWVKTAVESDWMYIGNSGDNPGVKACPAFNHLAVFPYGSKLVAFGGDNTASGAKMKGFENVYVSDDYGISWLPSEGKNVFPDAFRTDDVRNRAFSYLIKGGRLWIFWSAPVDGAYIWRGNLNKTQFLRK